MLVDVTLVDGILVYQTLVYIENRCPELQPDTIMWHFELAALNTVKIVFFATASLVYGYEMEEGGNQDFRNSSGMYAKRWSLAYP